MGIVRGGVVSVVNVTSGASVGGGGGLVWGWWVLGGGRGGRGLVECECVCLRLVGGGVG